MSVNFSGVYAALATPFKQNGEVSFGALEQLIEFLIARGMDGFFVCGSAAEAYLLRAEERRDILDAVIAKNAGRVKIIAHVGDIGLERTRDLGLHAKLAGADAIAALPPFYYKYSRTEIIQYFKDIAVQTDMPLILYNFPGQTNYAITPNDYDELCRDARIIGVKNTSYDLAAAERFKFYHPERFVLTGYDDILLYGLIAGSDGGIGSGYNFMPELVRALYDAFAAGDLESAKNTQHEINSLLECTARYGMIPTAKRILLNRGIDVGPCRAPFAKLNDDALKDIDATCARFF